MAGVSVRRATAADLELVAPLFDAYRQFYGQAPDGALARRFIAERLAAGDSVILLAVDFGGRAAGFTQLYPAFSSVAARHIWILNDLFVAPEARRGGVARLLLEAARRHGAETGARRLVLATAHTNHAAQRLYESSGYVRDEQFAHYELEL